jgi:hypothetical protein
MYSEAVQDLLAREGDKRQSERSPPKRVKESRQLSKC